MSVNFIFALALFNFTGVKAAPVMLSLYALHLGAQPFAVGVLAATFSALPMLLSWQIGKMADRFGTRRPIMFGSVCGAFGMLLPYFMPGLPALFAAAAMNGLMHASCVASLQNLVGILSDPESRSRNFSNLSLLTSATAFFGPLLVGFSIDHSGHAVACLYLVLLALGPVAMLAIWGGALPRGSRSSGPSGSIKDLLAGSGLWRVLITTSLVITGVDLFQFYMPIYGYGLGLSASAIGIVLAMFAAATFIVRMIVARLIARFTAERVLVYSFFIGAACLVLIPFFKTMVILSLLAFSFGIGMGCGMPITMMMTFSNSGDGRSGEAMGLRVTVNQLTRVVVPVVFGSIGSVFGLFPAFWINALMLASGGAITKPGSIAQSRTCQ